MGASSPSAGPITSGRRSPSPALPSTATCSPSFPQHRSGLRRHALPPSPESLAPTHGHMLRAPGHEPDHIARAVPDDGGPEDAVGALLDVDLDEAFRLTLQDGAIVVLELRSTERVEPTADGGAKGAEEEQLLW